MKKVVYIVGDLSYPNGMSRVLSQKVNYLARHTDYELYVVLTEKASKPWYYQLEPNIKHVNFDLNFDDLAVYSAGNSRKVARKVSVHKISGEILRGAGEGLASVAAFNDFGHPDDVHPAAFTDFKTEKGNVLKVNLPAASIVVLDVE